MTHERRCGGEKNSAQELVAELEIDSFDVNISYFLDFYQRLEGRKLHNIPQKTLGVNLGEWLWA